MRKIRQAVGYIPKGKEQVSPPAYDCSPECLTQSFAVLEGRWKLSILHELFGPEGEAPPNKRFSELERAIPRISQKMLIQQLRCLESEGIVQRTVYPQVPPKVEYRLTVVGEALRPALRALVFWANARKRLKDGEHKQDSHVLDGQKGTLPHG